MAGFLIGGANTTAAGYGAAPKTTQSSTAKGVVGGVLGRNATGSADALSFAFKPPAPSSGPAPAPAAAPTKVKGPVDSTGRKKTVYARPGAL